MDQHLVMLEFIKKTCAQCFLHLRDLSSIRSVLTQEAAESLVHAFIASRLDYANALLIGAPDYALQRLQRIQNLAARTVKRASRWDSAHELLRQLHWLPVRERIDYKALLLAYKALHGLAPTYLADMLHPYHPSRPLRSADRENLQVPRTFSRYGSSTFTYHLPKLWNELPFHVKSAASLPTFKSALKTFLFSRAFN